MGGTLGLALQLLGLASGLALQLLGLASGLAADLCRLALGLAQDFLANSLSLGSCGLCDVLDHAGRKSMYGTRTAGVNAINQLVADGAIDRLEGVLDGLGGALPGSQRCGEAPRGSGGRDPRGGQGNGCQAAEGGLDEERHCVVV